MLPPDLAERPHDPAYGVPVPFVCGDDGLGEPLKKRVVQCALSRICGLCGRSLSWGVTFLGSSDEADANIFHFPPLHSACAEAALHLYPGLALPVLGQREGLEAWAIVTTGGFELIRPASRGGDMRMVFRANAVSKDRRVSSG